MNDRFRFRVWNKEKNKYEDDLYYEAGDLQVACVNKIFEEYISDGYVIEQCTGLKDKNGKLIYEGDLIKSPNNNNLLEVIWEKGVWQTKEYREKGMHELFLYILATEYGVEIIGNIHEKESK